MVQSFRDLLVWQKGVSVAEEIYKATEKFPRSELFGLTGQMRRASVSIPSNVAEGKAAGGRSYLKHVRIALGSTAELETQLEIAIRLKFVTNGRAEALQEQAAEVGRMLSGLLAALRRHEPKKRRT